jgi:hypothetical protein
MASQTQTKAIYNIDIAFKVNEGFMIDSTETMFNGCLQKGKTIAAHSMAYVIKQPKGVAYKDQL